MEQSTLWWLAAGIVVAAELLTGSFYLLMLALGACRGPRLSGNTLLVSQETHYS